MLDSSRHFDAPRTSSGLAGAKDLVRARWGVLLALGIAVAIIVALAFGALLVDRTARALVASAASSTSIVVQLDARTSAVDADALGPRIKAMPDVADATLTGRDEALKSLVAAGLPPPDGRNPLPDVWTVRLRAPVADGDAPLWASTVADLRRALAALPQVESTRVDERWVGTVDTAVARWATWRGIARPVICATLAVLLGCVGFIAGRGLVAGLAARPSVSVLAIAGTTAVAIGLVCDVAVSALIGGLITPSTGAGTEGWIASSTFSGMAPTLLALSLFCWAVTALSMLVGGHRSDSEKTSSRVAPGPRNY